MKLEGERLLSEFSSFYPATTLIHCFANIAIYMYICCYMATSGSGFMHRQCKAALIEGTSLKWLDFVRLTTMLYISCGSVPTTERKFSVWTSKRIVLKPNLGAQQAQYELNKKSGQSDRVSRGILGSTVSERVFPLGYLNESS